MISFLKDHPYSAMVLGYAALPFIFEAAYEKFGTSNVKESIDVADVDVLSSGQNDNVSKARIKLSRDEAKRPDVAYPTIALSALSLGAWLYNFHRYHNSSKSTSDKLKALLLGSAATFASFTPLHDATHYAISKYRWLNELVGSLAGIPLATPLLFFRYVHLMHHRHTNNQDADLDPDNWAGRGPAFLMPLRWATVVPYYIYWVRKTWRNAGRAETKVQERSLAKVKLHTAVVFGSALAAAVTMAEKLGDAVLYCWLLPLQIATCYLMYVFDYLPHRPHKIPAKVDPYKATHILKGPFSIKDLDLALLFQNYHLVHHLWPSIPFYKMGTVYHNHREEFAQNGTRVLPVLLNPSREVYLEELNQE